MYIYTYASMCVYIYVYVCICIHIGRSDRPTPKGRTTLSMLLETLRGGPSSLLVANPCIPATWLLIQALRFDTGQKPEWPMYRITI